MKKTVIALTLCSLFAASHAIANDKLAQSSGCMTCHAMDRKNIGPSYKDIAAKYSGDKNAAAMLIKKVRAGGSGVWGPTPMPPNAHVKEEDVKVLVQWILATK